MDRLQRVGVVEVVVVVQVGPLEVAGHEVVFGVIWFQGAQFGGVVAVQIHVVVRLDVLQSVGHLYKE